MTDDKTLIENMLAATNKCLDLAKNINSQQDLKNSTFFFDTILTNLTLINDIYNKLNEQTKQKIGVNWCKFDFYGKELLNVKEKLNLDLILKILKEELPVLQKILNKFLNAPEI